MSTLKRKLQEVSNHGPGGPGGDGASMPKRKAFPDKPAKKEAVTITDINVASFAEHRSIEVQAMAELVKDTGGNHTAFQKLPRHMRRRAMSHNIKRIPRRLHSVAKLELAKTKPPGKRPSRRHRRRPSNLLLEYERRKRRVGWLETHIWHAKRFKMVEKWGYKLALHPNEKSIRACYRAVRHHCLLQDVSYEAHIELKGAWKAILAGLMHLTSSETGLTFAAKLTAQGTRQGHVVVYSYDSYPQQAIGPVTFLWRVQTKDQYGDEEQTQSTLWISCHPSIHSSVLKELKKCFSPNLRTEDISCSEGAVQVDPITEDCNVVTVTCLKDQLVKFRLFGPASNRVLAETLKLADITNTSSTTASAVGEASAPDSVKSMWWKKLYPLEANKKVFGQQSELWSKVAKCQSPSELPPGCVLALTVRDPRLLLPPKRNKVSVTGLDSVTKTLPEEMFSEEAARSALWDSWVREDVKTTKIPEQKLNMMKSKHLVPGTPLELGDLESRIPIILVQRPGTSTSAMSQTNVSHGCGWDLLLPSGFAMAFWVALVYRGARVGGIREARSVDLQAGLLSVPCDYPDSHAGHAELAETSELREAKHDRMPPAKRPNFVKLGFPSPFRFEYDKLVKEWCDRWNPGLEEGQPHKSTEGRSMHVLRNRKMLRLLSSVLSNPRGFFNASTKKGRSPANGQVKTTVTGSFLSTETGRKLINEELLSVVPVRLMILQKGVPATFGRICSPVCEDLEALDRDKTFGGPVEPKHSDPGMVARKEERKERLRLRRRRKRGKGKKLAPDSPGAGQSGSTSKALPQSSCKVSSLEKTSGENSSEPKKSQPVLGLTSRDTLGHVRSGDFDLVTGQGLGFGFCSVAALLHLIEQQKDRRACLVLLRNSSSFQYRFASVQLIF